MAACTGFPFFQQGHRLGGGDGQVSESWDGAVRAEARESLRRGVVCHKLACISFLYIQQ
jgi:hypothetical protein